MVAIFKFHIVAIFKFHIVAIFKFHMVALSNFIWRPYSNPTFQIIGKLEKFSDGNCGLSASFGNIAA